MELATHFPPFHVHNFPDSKRAAASKCEAAYPEDGHDGSSSATLSATKRAYKCGLTRRNPKGFKFCKACSQADLCPMCGGDHRN